MSATAAAAMSAAGAIVDIFQTGNQQKIIRLGRKVEHAAFETNMAALELQTTEASLDEMVELRKVIGSQIAMNAARGTASGAGSAVAVMGESFATFEKDERVRRINLLSKQATLRAGDTLSGLKQLTSETQLGQALTKRIFGKAITAARG
jgi:hypothetical protein